MNSTNLMADILSGLYVDVKNDLLEKRRDTLVEYLFLLLCGAVLISSDSAAVVAAATSAALQAAVA